jgi:glycosyltransferase involved in cell wall biosynthesis
MSARIGAFASSDSARDDDIAVNATVVGERPTGLGVYTMRLITALDRLGERLTVFTSRPDAIDAPRSRVEQVTSATRPERGARGHLRRLLWTQTGLRFALRARPPRALLNPVAEGLIGARIPQVTVIHDVLPLRYPAEYRLQQPYLRHYVPRVLASSAAVVVNSECTRRDVLAVYRLRPDKVHVALCGFDERRFFPDPADAPRQTDPYALFVGNVLPHKNLARLVEAFAAARARRPFRLVIRGGGRPEHVSALRARIDALGVGAHVDWQPWAGDDELLTLYRGARMLVLPSLYEGFGLPALEAMACGTPVIVSNVASLPEVVGDAAVFVDPEDVGSISAAMTRLLSDDALAKELRGRGLARARSFSWERTARQVQAVLRAVTGQERQRL